MIRDSWATQRNKWQQKRSKTDNGMTINMEQAVIDGTQGANKEVKSPPSMFKNKVFLLVVKNI